MSNPQQEKDGQRFFVENPDGTVESLAGVETLQPVAVQGSSKARLQCHHCSRLLEYDAGAQYVQCFSCSTMNAVQQGSVTGGRVLSMLCAVCHTTNLAPYGVNYIRCGSCSTISQVSHAYRQNPPPQQQPTGPAVPRGGNPNDSTNQPLVANRAN